MKKKIRTVLLVTLLFFPTLIALGNFIVTGLLGDIDTAASITILTPDGTTHTINRRTTPGGQEVIATLSEAIQNAERANPPAETLDTLSSFTVAFDVRSDDPQKIAAATYVFLLSPQNELAYMTDSGGNMHRIASSDIASFLETEYAAALYDTSINPRLFTSSGEVILPESGVWNYKIYNGKYVRSSEIELAPNAVYHWGGAVDFSFDREPNTCLITIYDGSRLLFKGSPAEYRASELVAQTGLHYKIVAAWSKDSYPDGYGLYEYSFSSNRQEPAEFSLRDDTLTAGEFTVITGKTAADPEKIMFESQPAMDFEPTFFVDGTYVRALLPTDMTLTEETKYTLTISYGGAKSELSLTVTPRETVLERTYDDKTISVTLNEKNRDEYNAIRKTILSSMETTKYISGPFFDYEDRTKTDATILLGFGHRRILTSGAADFRLDGVDFFAASGDNVLAANNGKVVYTGTSTLAGNMVVIDHGLGLKTWYMHLSEISVSRGAVVKTGEIIGKAGKTGFTNLTGFYFLTTVKEVPVSPYSLWTDGLPLPNP